MRMMLAMATFEKEQEQESSSRYDTTIYCVLKVPMLLQYGYDLFLTSNWVLIFDDVDLQFIRIVESYPHLGLNVFHESLGHGLPSEVPHGTWTNEMTLEQKYEEYFSSDEISEYIDPWINDIVKWRIPKSIVPKRRQSAWEFMDQKVPEKFLDCISSLFDGRRSGGTVRLGTS